MAESYLGEIRMFAGDYAPAGWAICDGRLLDVAQYGDLFALLGTTYGGDGQTTFALPDLRGRSPVHAGQGPGLSTYARGEQGGTEQVTLRAVELPPHNHILYASKADATASSPGGNSLATSTSAELYTEDVASVGMSPQSVGVAGASQPHGNRPPYLVLSYIIALSGVFPERP